MMNRLTVINVFTIAALTYIMYSPNTELVWKIIAGVAIIGWGIFDTIKN